MTHLHIPVAVRWADLDAYRHVNNVEMFRLLEEARISALWQHPDELMDWPTAVLESGVEATSHTFVARQEIEYLRPLPFSRVPVRVEMWIGRLGGASLELFYEVHEGGTPYEPVGPASGAQPYARAAATIVLVDAATGSPRRITAAERAVWEQFMDEPITFRRR